MAGRIIIRRIHKPVQKKLGEDIEWFCESFGLSTGRDTQNVATKVVRKILTLEPRQTVSSENLAAQLDLSVGRVNHHLRNLIDAGLLYRHKKRLYVRGGSLKAAVQEIRKDTERTLDEIEKIAEEIDSKLGLKSRE